MIYSNLSKKELNQAIQTKIEIYSEEPDTTKKLFKNIEKEATLMCLALQRPFHECKLALLYLENLKDSNL